MYRYILWQYDIVNQQPNRLINLITLTKEPCHRDDRLGQGGHRRKWRRKRGMVWFLVGDRWKLQRFFICVPIIGEEIPKLAIYFFEMGLKPPTRVIFWIPFWQLFEASQLKPWKDPRHGKFFSFGFWLQRWAHLLLWRGYTDLQPYCTNWWQARRETVLEVHSEKVQLFTSTIRVAAINYGLGLRICQNILKSSYIFSTFTLWPSQSWKKPRPCFLPMFWLYPVLEGQSSHGHPGPSPSSAWQQGGRRIGSGSAWWAQKAPLTGGILQFWWEIPLQGHWGGANQG